MSPSFAFSKSEANDATYLLFLTSTSHHSRQHLPFHRTQIEEIQKAFPSIITSERILLLLRSSHLRRRRGISFRLASSHRALLSLLQEPLPSFSHLSSSRATRRSDPTPLDFERKRSHRPYQGSRFPPPRPSNLSSILSTLLSFGVPSPYSLRCPIALAWTCAWRGRSRVTGRCGGSGR